MPSEGKAEMTTKKSMQHRELEEIINQHSPRIRSYVRSRVSNRDDADDIVQDTFHQFLRAVSIMDNPVEKVTSWLYTVAHNLIINHGRKRHEDDSYMMDLTEIMAASDADSPDMQMLRNMVWQELDRALAELPKEQREAVLLTEIEGLSVKVAAERMGVPLNTFLSRKHYAILHIRKRLRGLYDEIRRA